MFKRVMWATDGSEAADQVLPLVRSLVTEASGELLVVHCVEFTISSKAGSFPIHADEDELRAKIERQVAELSGEGPAASLQILTSRAGGAAHAIADAARASAADVIVVGTRGHTVLSGLLLGSVTQRLLHITPCPVLAMPTKARDAEASTMATSRT